MISPLSLLPGRRRSLRLNSSSPFTRGLTLAFFGAPHLGNGIARNLVPGGSTSSLLLGAAWNHGTGLGNQFQAIKFDGSDAQLSFPQPQAYLPCTMAVVARSASVNSVEWMLFHHSTGGNDGIGMSVNSGAFSLVYQGAWSEGFEPGAPMNDNEWTFLAATFPPEDTANIRAFAAPMFRGSFHAEVDSSGGNTFTPIGTPDTISIGSHAGRGDLSFSGDIAIALRYDHVKDAAEVEALYKELSAGCPTLLVRDSPVAMQHTAAAPAGGIKKGTLALLGVGG